MDKNKIIQTATKYMQRGQYDRAIAEYRKILKVDPDDVRVLLKIGEIQQKKGENIVAATTLFDVAKAYAADGFFLKAVAVYKQVLKLDPARVDVSLLLAELYQQLGLMSDAMTQLQAASAHYEAKGETGKVLEIARRMLATEPNDLGARIRVADLLHREGDVATALEELRHALSSLKDGESSDDFLKIGERIVAIDPADVALGKKLASAWLQRGDTRRALSRLQTCFQQDPRHPETLELLGKAFVDLSQQAKAVSVYKELAKVHREDGRRSDELAAWRKVAQLSPSDTDAAEALATGGSKLPPTPPAFVPGPAAAPPPRPVTRSSPGPAGLGSFASIAEPVSPGPSKPRSSGPSATPPGDDALGRLLTETDVFVKYGLIQKASDHLDKIFALDPECIPAHEKAVEIQRGRHPAALAASLAALARLHARSGDFSRGRPYFEEFRTVAPGHQEALALASLYEEAALAPTGDVKAAASAAPVESAVAAVSAPAEGPEPILIEIDALDPLDPLEPVDPLDALDDEPLLLAVEDEESAVEIGTDWDEPVDPIWMEGADDEALLDLASETVEDEVVDPLLDGEGDDWIPPRIDTATETVETADTGALPFAGPEEITGLDLPAPDEDRTRTIAPEQLLELQALEAGDETVELEPFDASVEIEAFEEARDASAELAEAAALVQAGKFDEAEAFYRSILERWPGHPDATARLGVVLAWRNIATERPAPAAPAMVEESGIDILPPETGSEWEPIEIDRQDLGFESQEQEIVSSPGDSAELWAPDPSDWASAGPHSTAGWMPDESAPFELGGDIGALGDGEGLFDLGAVLAEELAAEEASGGPTFGPGPGGFQFPADQVLEQFKAGVAQTVKPEDVDTHYNLAIAYREMGLFDDAIEALELARSGCAGEAKEIDCLMLIGLCHQARGEGRKAIEVLREGAGLAGSPDVEKALLFEIAQILEAEGEDNEALATYGRVARIDGGYRDVKQMITRLVAGGAEMPGRTSAGTV